MNRLQALRNRELNSSIASSINGYETANDDSFNSLYFSMSENEENLDKTLEAQDKLDEPVTVKKSIDLSSPMTVIAAKLKDQQIGVSSTPQKLRSITEFPDLSGIQLMPSDIEVNDNSVIEIDDTKMPTSDAGDSVILVGNCSVNSTQASNANEGPQILAEFFAHLDGTPPNDSENKDWIPQIVVTEPSSPEKINKENDSVIDFKMAVQKSEFPVPATKLRDRGAIKKRLSVLTENRVASPINKNRKSNIKSIPTALKELRSKGAGDGPSNNLRSIIANVEPITKIVLNPRKSMIPPPTNTLKVDRQNSAPPKVQIKRNSMIPPPSTAPSTSKNPQSNLKTRQSLLPPSMAAKVAQKPQPILKIPSKTTLAAESTKKRSSIGKRRSTGETKSNSSLGKRKSTTTVDVPQAKTSRKTLMPPPKTAPTSFQCKKCPKNFRFESNLITHMRTHEQNPSKAKKDEPKCAYCDKKFQIQNALDTHLKEKCIKIPDLERKKLLYPKQNQKSVNSSSDLSSASTSSEGNKTAPAKSEKKRKNLSGIPWTPNKKLTCGTCKKEFLDVFLYSVHMTEHDRNEKPKMDEIESTDTE